VCPALRGESDEAPTADSLWEFSCRPAVILEVAERCMADAQTQDDWKSKFGVEILSDDVPFFAKVRFTCDEEEVPVIYPSICLCGPPGPIIFKSPRAHTSLFCEVHRIAGMTP
jgi:hypothetical protein